MDKYPKAVSKHLTKILLEQMNNSIYKINLKNSFNLGFFFKIKYDNENIPILMTSNQILNEMENNKIDISLNNENKKIEYKEIIYKNNDLVMLTIKEKYIKDINYLELDNSLYEDNTEILYQDESIYIIHLDKIKKDISVSYGLVNYINNFDIKYSCNIQSDIGISPIFNLSNNKIIGIHNCSSILYNQGINMKNLIKEFIKHYKIEKLGNKKYLKTKGDNEIDICIDVDNFKDKEKIYFLDNYEYKDNKGISHFHDNLKELNKINTELYINKIKYDYEKYFVPKNIGEYNIKLKFNINLSNCSYMFAGCDKIKSINFIKFTTKYIKNMKYMFAECKNLRNIDLFLFNTKNVNNLDHIFYECKNLRNLDLSSFNIENVEDVGYMFYGCEKLMNIDFSFLNNENVYDITDMFRGYNNLNFIPFRNKNFTNISTEIINYGCEYVFEFKSVIKTKNKENYLLNKIKSIKYLENKGDLIRLGNKIILFKDEEYYVINLIKINEGNDIKTDYLIIEYDINDVNSFKEAEIFCKKINNIYQNKSIYLIGINFNDKKINIPKIQFENLNNINHISISSNNDKDIKTILNNLSLNLKKFEIPCSNTFKVFILAGVPYVGKTNLIDRIVWNKFESKTMPSTGFDYSSKKIILKSGKEIMLQLWEYDSKEWNRNKVSYNIKYADCLMFLYDVTDKDSFKNLKDYYKSIKKEFEKIKLIYLIGNKIDLIFNNEKERQIRKEEAIKYANENNFIFYETSCKENIGIKEIYSDLIKKIKA